METIGLVFVSIAFGLFSLLAICVAIWPKEAWEILEAPIKMALARIARILIESKLFLDDVREPYAKAYLSGGKFFALASSQKGFGPVMAPGDLDWGIRRPGEKDTWIEYTDENGVVHPAGEHIYKAGLVEDGGDFFWDRRLKIIKWIFGKDTGVVWMGLPGIVTKKYYNLRLNNFRTVRPSEEEIAEKEATLREYKIGGQTAGYLISWNEWSDKVLLADDLMPIPVDGVRIGVKLDEGKKQEAVSANVLVFFRGRVQEPYLYLFRAEDTLELIQNELIQQVRLLCSTKCLKEILAFTVSLESDKADQNNPILATNNFGKYMSQRYGFTIKGASFAIIDVLGEAGVALSAPYVAAQMAEATALKGDGEGRAEASRLTLQGTAFKTVIDEIGMEAAIALRSADVAGQIATSDNKTNTVFLGLDIRNIIGGLTGTGGIPPKGKDVTNGSTGPQSRPELQAK